MAANRKITPGHSVLVGILGVALLGLSACGEEGLSRATGSEGPTASAAMTPAQARREFVTLRDLPEPDDVGFSSLPLSGEMYRSSEQDLVAAVDAQQREHRRRIVDCVAAQGSSTDFAFGPAENIVFAALGRPASAEAATDRGLNIARDATFSAEYTPVSDGAGVTSDGDQPVDQAVLDGCVRLAPIAFPQLAPGGVFEAYRTEVMGDPIVAAARTTWQRCMAHAGYDVASFAQLRNSVAPSYEEASALASDARASRLDFYDNELRRRESRPAETSVRCDRFAYSPIIDQWKSLEERFIAIHAAELAQLPPQLDLLFGAYVDL